MSNMFAKSKLFSSILAKKELLFLNNKKIRFFMRKAFKSLEFYFCILYNNL